jgi:hypothetical protein
MTSWASAQPSVAAYLPLQGAETLGAGLNWTRKHDATSKPVNGAHGGIVCAALNNREPLSYDIVGSSYWAQFIVKSTATKQQ